MLNLTDDTPITELLNIFLTDKYKYIKDDINNCYKDLYISDLKMIIFMILLIFFQI